MTPSVAEFTIRMDQSLSFRYDFRGDRRLLVGVLGAARYCEDWLVEQIKIDAGNAPKESIVQKPEHISLETEVTKEEAHAFYVHAALKLKDRLDAIKNSDPSATFAIDPSLLENL